MKKKNGFTLTELLVVIAMLAVVGTVIIVNTIAINNRAKDSEYERMVENIKNAAKTYVSLYPEEFGDLYSSKAFAYVSLKEIVHAGLLDEETVNPYTKENLNLEDKYLGYVKAYVDGDSFEMVYTYPLTDDDYDTQVWLHMNTITLTEDEDSGFPAFYLYYGVGPKNASTDFGFCDENGNFINSDISDSRSLIEKYKEDFNINVTLPTGDVLEKCTSDNSKCSSLHELYGGDINDYYIPKFTGTFDLKINWSYEVNGKTISRSDTRLLRVISYTEREKERISTSASTTTNESTTANEDGVIFELDNYEFHGDYSMPTGIRLFSTNDEGKRQPFSIYIQGKEDGSTPNGTIFDSVDSSGNGISLNITPVNNYVYLSNCQTNSTANTFMYYTRNKRFRILLYYNPDVNKYKLYYRFINDVDATSALKNDSYISVISYTSDKQLFVGGRESKTDQYTGKIEKFIIYNKADPNLIYKNF